MVDTMLDRKIDQVDKLIDELLPNINNAFDQNNQKEKDFFFTIENGEKFYNQFREAKIDLIKNKIRQVVKTLKEDVPNMEYLAFKVSEYNDILLYVRTLNYDSSVRRSISGLVALANLDHKVCVDIVSSYNEDIIKESGLVEYSLY